MSACLFNVTDYKNGILDSVNIYTLGGERNHYVDAPGKTTREDVLGHFAEQIHKLQK